MLSTPTKQDFEVQRDGVKLGWNVLAIMASIGLGLYVTSMVSPIKIEQDNQRILIEKTTKILEQHVVLDEKRFDELNLFIESQKERNDRYLELISDLKREIERLRGNQ